MELCIVKLLLSQVAAQKLYLGLPIHKAVDAHRLHHQLVPDELLYEQHFDEVRQPEADPENYFGRGTLNLVAQGVLVAEDDEARCRRR